MPSSERRSRIPGSIVAVTRRPLRQAHPKLETTVLPAFSDFESLRPIFSRTSDRG